MKLYLGLADYDNILPEEIYNAPYNGYILGDLFCNKKMFKYGEAGFYETASLIKECDKEVIYQTPMYLTDRTFSDEIVRIQYLYERNNINKILVQDIGLILWIKNNMPEMEIIWSRLGKTRNSIINHDFVEFLKSLNVSAMEVDEPEKIKAIVHYNMPVYSVYGSFKYNTLSRDCYNRYLLNKFDGICDRECINLDMSLHLDQFSMSVDGHVLGKRTNYNDSSQFYQLVKEYSTNIMIYANEQDSAKQRYRRIADNILFREEERSE